jgi:hypothetical protein
MKEVISAWACCSIGKLALRSIEVCVSSRVWITLNSQWCPLGLEMKRIYRMHWFPCRSQLMHRMVRSPPEAVPLSSHLGGEWGRALLQPIRENLTDNRFAFIQITARTDKNANEPLFLQSIPGSSHASANTRFGESERSSCGTNRQYC